MDPTADNRRAWDEVHVRRAAAHERPALPEAARELLPDLAGRKVLHLGCSTGEATAALAALGALVTGLDPSPQALEAAREQAPNALFLAGDVHALPPDLRRGRFDLVLVLDDALGLVTELEPWALGIAAALRPDGSLLLHCAHPVVACLDAALRWREDYFDTAWGATLGEVVTAVAQAGLVVAALAELPEPERQRQDPRVPAQLVLSARKPG